MSERSPAPRGTDADESPTGIGGNRRTLTRYDLLLAAIPTAFLAGVVASRTAGVPLRVAMPAAATVGALALIDGLFLNPPRRPGTGDGSA